MRAAIAINISAAQAKRAAISPWTIVKNRKRNFISFGSLDLQVGDSCRVPYIPESRGDDG
jgi:hypothetical protein